MRKMVWILLLLVCVGCVTVKVPKYLKDEFPYKKKFYASFEDTITATQRALKEAGWHVSDISSPTVFEGSQAASVPQGKQVLIFTEIRQTPLIFSSRYMSLNVYVRASDDGTDVEIRYISVVPMFFKNSESYKNDTVANKILERISGLLEK